MRSRTATSGGRLSPNRLMTDICRVFGVTQQQIMGGRRTEEIAIPRHFYVGMLIRSGYGYSELGRLMNRDHGTMINSRTRMEQTIETNDRKWRKEVAHLRRLGYKL